MLRCTSPGAAPRVPREAAGRRAWQLALLVGGLFALGFLFGGQAHAAEGGPVPLAAATAHGAADGTAQDSADVTARDSAHVTAQDPAPMQVDGVVRPVREAVTAVTEQVEPDAQDLPVIPDATGVTDLTRLTGLTEPTDLPGLPSLPSSPVRTLPVPVTVVHPPGSAGKSSPDPRGSGGAVVAPTAVYGPVVSGLDGLAGPGGVGTARRGAAPVRTGVGQAPAHPGPAGDPSGVLGGASVLDGAASRHGDAHAVTQNHRVPLWPAAGGAVPSYAAETQDRYRDFPVVPG